MLLHHGTLRLLAQDDDFFKRVLNFRQTSLEREQLSIKSVFYQTYLFRDSTHKILQKEKFKL